ncbi:MAG: GGDEF domain-containing protein [Opitutae bacterium]|nr:GGDEF domain-containing protein [Opitutae bacterium]
MNTATGEWGVAVRTVGVRVGLCRIGVAGRIALLLLVLVLAPMASVLVMLEAGVVNDPINLLVVGLAVALGLLVPVSRAAASFLVLHDLRALNAFCLEIQHGRYGARFPVGLERDDEHEVLRLKRNMNWMAHHIETQTRWLHARLDESVSRTRRYEALSFRDALTGVYNRRFFDQLLPDLCRDRGGRTLFLALMDCDAFKQVNDRHGHAAGDRVLMALGAAISESIRDGVDYPFRFGGDEFGVVFRDLDSSACLAACERIRCRFAASGVHDCTVSIGLAGCAGGDSRALLDRCDAALYRAKALGGNRTIGAVDGSG